jgi:hypothetical protein
MAAGLVLAGGSLATPVAAQAAFDAQRAPGLDRPERLTPQEIQRLFDAYALVQAQEQIGLSESQYGPFVTRFKALQDLRRAHQQRRERLIRDLARLSRPGAPASGEGELKARYDELTAFEGSAVDELRRAVAALDEGLDLRQRARLRVFVETMERRKLELLLRARQSRPAPRDGALRLRR